MFYFSKGMYRKWKINIHVQIFKEKKQNEIGVWKNGLCKFFSEL